MFNLPPFRNHWIASDNALVDPVASTMMSNPSVSASHPEKRFLTESGWQMLYPSSSFPAMDLRSVDSSVMVTSLKPWWWKRHDQSKPMIPAPMTRIWASSGRTPLLSQPAATQEYGWHKSPSLTLRDSGNLKTWQAASSMNSAHPPSTSKPTYPPAAQYRTWPLRHKRHTPQ